MFQIFLDHTGRIAIISLAIFVAAAVIFFSGSLPFMAVAATTVILVASLMVCLLATGLWIGSNNEKKYTKAHNTVSDLLQATKEYNNELDRVIEDRSNITLTISDLNERAKFLEDRNKVRRSVEHLNQNLSHKPSYHDHGSNSHRLFQEGVRLPQSLHSEKGAVERGEISDIFEKLLFSYPQFDDTRENDPNYLRVAHKELVEHHLLVLASKNQYVESVNKVLEVCEKWATKDRVETPALGGRVC